MPCAALDGADNDARLLRGGLWLGGITRGKACSLQGSASKFHLRILVPLDLGYISERFPVRLQTVKYFGLNTLSSPLWSPGNCVVDLGWILCLPNIA